MKDLDMIPEGLDVFWPRLTPIILNYLHWKGVFSLYISSQHSDLKKKLVLACIQELETWLGLVSANLRIVLCELRVVFADLDLTYIGLICVNWLDISMDLPKTQLVFIFGFSLPWQASTQVWKVQICTDRLWTRLNSLWLVPTGVRLVWELDFLVFRNWSVFSFTVFVFVSLSLLTFLTLLLLNEHTPSRYRLVSLTIVHNEGPIIRLADRLPVMFVVSETLSEGPCSGLWWTVLVSHGGGGIPGPGEGAV